MNESFTTKAIVLHRRSIGENSEAVLLLSPQRGRIDVACRGLNKPRSALRGKVEPFNELEGLVVKGRGNLWNLTQAKIIKIRPTFYASYECMCWGCFLLELASKIAPGVREDAYLGTPEECRAFYSILKESLDGIESQPRKGVAVSIWALGRFVPFLGIAPNLDNCCICQKRKPTGFSVALGGGVCNDCLGLHGDVIWVEDEIWQLWRNFRNSTLEEALAEKHFAKIYAKAEALAWEHIRVHRNLELKARRLLKIGDYKV